MHYFGMDEEKKRLEMDEEKKQLDIDEEKKLKNSPESISFSDIRNVNTDKEKKRLRRKFYQRAYRARLKQKGLIRMSDEVDLQNLPKKDVDPVKEKKLSRRRFYQRAYRARLKQKGLVRMSDEVEIIEEPSEDPLTLVTKCEELPCVSNAQMKGDNLTTDEIKIDTSNVRVVVIKEEPVDEGEECIEGIKREQKVEKKISWRRFYQRAYRARLKQKGLIRMSDEVDLQNLPKKDVDPVKEKKLSRRRFYQRAYRARLKQKGLVRMSDEVEIIEEPSEDPLALVTKCEELPCVSNAQMKGDNLTTDEIKIDTNNVRVVVIKEEPVDEGEECIEGIKREQKVEKKLSWRRFYQRTYRARLKQKGLIRMSDEVDLQNLPKKDVDPVKEKKLSRQRFYQRAYRARLKQKGLVRMSDEVEIIDEPSEDPLTLVTKCEELPCVSNAQMKGDNLTADEIKIDTNNVRVVVIKEPVDEGEEGAVFNFKKLNQVHMGIQINVDEQNCPDIIIEQNGNRSEREPHRNSGNPARCEIPPNAPDESSTNARRAKPHECQYCRKCFRRKWDLTRHIPFHTSGNEDKRSKLVHKRQPYECHYCGKCFERKCSIFQHILTHTSIKLHNCSFCGKGYRRKIDLRRHCIVVHDNTMSATMQDLKLIYGRQPFECHYCGKRYWGKQVMFQHILIHNGIKLHGCRYCGKRFSKKSFLSQHIHIHTGEKPYMCHHCGERYRFQTNFMRHIIGRHGNSPQYQCHYCGILFLQRDQLNRHCLNHTGNGKVYKCDSCSKCFFNKSSLAKHILIHTGKKHYKCDHCGKCFFQQINLSKHLLVHTGELPYRCDECGKCFAHLQNCQIHARTHTGEKPYRCEECGKYFGNLQYFRIHKLVHTGVKPYQCEVCGKRFAYQSYLPRHMFLHTGETPYKCDHCGNGYRDKKSLREHIILTHIKIAQLRTRKKGSSTDKAYFSKIPTNLVL